MPSSGSASVWARVAAAVALTRLVLPDAVGRAVDGAAVAVVDGALADGTPLTVYRRRGAAAAASAAAIVAGTDKQRRGRATAGDRPHPPAPAASRAHQGPRRHRSAPTTCARRGLSGVGEREEKGGG